MANIIKDLQFTELSARVKCADTSDLKIGMKIESSNLSFGSAVIIYIIDNTDFEISCIAKKTKTIKNVEFFEIPKEEVLELQAAGCLYDLMPDVVISLTPDDPANPNNYTGNTIVFLRYNGSSYADASSGAASMRAQERIINLEATIISNSQRNKNGALNTIDRVRRYLTRLMPIDCFKSWQITGDNFTGEYEGEWHFVINFNTLTHYRAGE